MKPAHKKYPIVHELVYNEMVSTGETYNGYVLYADGTIAYCLPEVVVKAEPVNPKVEVNRLSEFYCKTNTAYHLMAITTLGIMQRKLDNLKSLWKDVTHPTETITKVIEKDMYALANFLHSVTHDSLVKLGLDKYLDELTRSESELKASLAVTAEFALGLGPETRIFDETHAITQSLAESYMTTYAIRLYTKNLYDHILSNKKRITSFGVGLNPVPGSLEPGPLYEAFMDGGYSSPQFTGSVIYNITQQGSDYYFEVTNTTSLNSLWYHLSVFGKPSREQLKMGGNVHQVFRFKINYQEFDERSRRFF